MQEIYTCNVLFDVFKYQSHYTRLNTEIKSFIAISTSQEVHKGYIIENWIQKLLALKYLLFFYYPVQFCYSCFVH